MSYLEQINFKNLDDISGDVFCFFLAEGFKSKDIPLDDDQAKIISNALKIRDFTGKKNQICHFTGLLKAPYEQILIFGCGKSDDIQDADWRLMGGKLYQKLKALKIKQASVLSENIKEQGDEALNHFVMGAALGSYEFDKYKVKKSDDDNKSPKLKRIDFNLKDAKTAAKNFAPYQAIVDGILLARDLVNEPANILNPDHFKDRIEELSKDGLVIEVLDKKTLKAKKMNALLAVGQGSHYGSYLVIMKWMGDPKSKEAPACLVGKGVCFDTGGISIKPSGGMEDMKGDMGGAAAVTGTMLTLAKRKAKANVIGIVGLVENMPDALAQRPGDIITSMSGQTIEVINTDAEGRLVLADALWYAKETFNPKWMINLATLTGAIIIALGKEYAGLFSSDDKLAKSIVMAGEKSGDKVWRLPLHKTYDKMIDSKFADMKNTGGRGAGSITAAQFLKRFTDKTPWAHIDVAGMAMASTKTDINNSWGSGFGVALLNQLIQDSEK